MGTRKQREALLIRAVQMHYYDDMNYAQIANKLGVSRWTVSRMVQKARNEGIVRITINHPLARYREAEEKLQARYGLDEVVVTPFHKDENTTLIDVARSAAEYLCDMIPAPKRVAVSWGRTMAEVSRQLPDHWASGITVYQTNGGPSYTKAPIVAHSLQLMASKGKGVGRVLPVSALVDDPKVAQGLMQDHVIHSILQEASQADIICFSPGVIDTTSVLAKSGYLSTQDIETLVRMGAVADILCRFVNDKGQPVSASLDRCTIGISLTSLRRIRKRLLVASGASKLKPVLASLAGKYVTALVVDAKLAEGLLAAESANMERFKSADEIAS